MSATTTTTTTTTKRPREEGEEEERPAKRRRVASAHVVAQRQAAAAERKAMREFLGPAAKSGVDLIEVLLDDTLAEIGRSLVYDASDAMNICWLALDHHERLPTTIYRLHADLIYHPVARLLAMCNKRLEGVMKRALPILVPLDRYPSKAGIHLAWYAWFAGTRLFRASMFAKHVGAYSPPLGRPLFESADGNHPTLLGYKKMKRVTWRGNESNLVVLLAAAAFYFGQEENKLLFLDQYASHSCAGSSRVSNCLRYNPRRALGYNYSIVADHVAFAPSANVINFDHVQQALWGGYWDAHRPASSSLADLVIALCINGRLDVMDSVWKRVISTERHVDAVTANTEVTTQAWRAFFCSPAGAASRESHDWLHARLPLTRASTEETQVYLTCTSDKWLRDHDLHTRTKVSFDPFVYRSAFRCALASGASNVIGHGRIVTIVTPYVPLAQLTLGELKRYIELATTADDGMMDGLYEGMGAVQSIEAMRCIVGVLTDADQLRARIESYLQWPCEPAMIVVLFDRILDLMRRRTKEIGRAHV